MHVACTVKSTDHEASPLFAATSSGSAFVYCGLSVQEMKAILFLSVINGVFERSV